MKPSLTGSMLLALLASAAITQAQITLSVPTQYPTIQAAISAAFPGTTVLVRPGEYLESIDFLGKSIVVESTGGPYVTMIRPSGGARAVTFENGEGPNSVLRGFTIRNGRAPHGAAGTGLPGEPGGGIYCDRTSPTIQRCIITSCRAGSGASGANAGIGGAGGGIAAIGVQGGPEASPTIVSCVITDCQAGTEGSVGSPAQARGGHGGGIYAEFSSLQVRNCTIVNNRGGIALYSGNPGQAGGIMLGTGTQSAVITNSIVRENCEGISASTGGGGGIHDIEPIQHPAVTYCNRTINWINMDPSNFTAQPRFLDPSAGDYRLDHDSPCIDRGFMATPFTVASLDIDGQPRIARAAIDVGADEVPPAVYPGTHEDVLLESSVRPLDVPYYGLKSALANDLIELRISSPDGTFVGNGPIVLMAQLHPTGVALGGLPGLSEVHLSFGAVPGPMIIVGGLTQPLAQQVIPPSGLSLGFVVPMGLVGTSVTYQAFVAHPGAQNGVFAASDAHEIQIIQ